MDTDLQSLFKSLNIFSKDTTNGPAECLRLLSTLNNNLTQEQQNSSLLDLYLFQIFDKSNGLIVFLLNILHKKVFKKSLIKSLEIIYALINNFPQKLSKHIIEINDLCISITKSSASAEEKAKALEVFQLGLEKIDKCLENQQHYLNILKTIKQSLCTKETDTVKDALLCVLGTFAKKCSYLINDPQNLKNLFINNLEKEMVKKDKSQKLTHGIFKGLASFCDSFPLDPKSDKATLEKLYKHIKCMAKTTNIHSKYGNREALTFFANNVDLFKQEILKEYKGWHKYLLIWLDLGTEDLKVGVFTLKLFYQGLGKFLMEDANADKEICKHFISYFKTKIKSDVTLNREKRLSIQGIRFFSAACYKHLSKDEVQDVFIMIMQNFEQMFILEENPTSENWEFLPDYIQTVANLMRFKNFSTSELFCLQKAVINMIKSFPQLPYLHHSLVIDALVVALFSLKTNQHFDSFLEVVIYQGVVWSCSHHHISEISEDPSQKVITVKNYFPLWQGLIKLTYNRFYDKYRIYLDDRKFICTKIFNQLIKTLMILINKLNVSVSLKETNVPITEIQAAYKVEQADDFAIFLNVVDFYQEMFNNIDPKVFQKCINKLINHLISKCLKFPLISGFYKLLSFSLKIANSLNYFEEVTNQDASICCESLTQFLEILLKKMSHFKDELLIACLQVLLETPAKIITDKLPECTPAFITVFNVGRSYITLAEMGLNTLERWQNCMSPETFNCFLIKIIPALDSYLRSKSLGGLMQSNTSEKRRKTDQTLKKRKVLLEIEPELVQFQKRVLYFIGQQNNDICQAFVAPENYMESENWGASHHLIITLPYEDVKLDVALDAFVPRIVDLALYCSDRETRITACELLQGVVMVFLGKSKPMSQTGILELNELLKNISMPLLKLGCDIDQLVQQLFQPLFLQLIHWYTFSTHLRDSHVAIIIETLMEGITHPTDSNLRDFAGKCVNEFVKWTIKQSSQSRLAQDPANIKILVKQMRFFSSHPDPNKKLGAALILNNIYKELREEHSIINIFWIELLHIFVTSLDLIEFNDDENTLTQINHAINHLQRVFVEKHDLFNKSNDNRRVPSDVKGSTLKDVALWLLEETGSKSKHCRSKCMELFCALTPLVPGFKNNLQVFILENFGRKNYWIPEIYEKFLVDTPTLSHIKNQENSSVLTKWLQGFLCALDGYHFVVKNNLDQVKINSNTTVFKAIEYFLKHVQTAEIEQALNLVEEKTWIFTTIEKQRFNTLKSDCVLMILKLVNSVINNESLSKNSEIFFTPDLWNLILNIVFNPQLLAIGKNIAQNDTDIVQVLLNNIPRKIPQEKTSHLVGMMRDYIKENLVTTIDLKANVSLKQRNCIQGLLLLQKCSINRELQVEDFAKGLVEELLTNFCANIENDTIFLNIIQDTTLEHCTALLQFALFNENEFKTLLEYLYKPFLVHSLEFTREMSFGSFLLDLFSEVILKTITERFVDFLNKTLTDDEKLPETIDHLFAILNYLLKNNHTYKHLYKNISTNLLCRWNILQKFFDESKDNINLGLRFLKLLFTVFKSKETKLKQYEEITKWLILLLNNEFENWERQDVLDMNSQVLYYLLYLVDHNTNSSEEDELKFALAKVSRRLVAEKTTSVYFSKMASIIPSIKSTVILKFLLEVYTKLEADTVDLTPFLSRYIANASESLQEKTLEMVYELCFSDELLFQDKYKVAINVIPPLFQNCSLKCLEQFYVSNVLEILETLQKPSSENNLIDKIIQFILVELLFLRIPVGSKERTNCPITNKALNTESKNNPKLMHLLLKVTFDALKDPLVAENCKELKRLYKCHAYNASVSIVCNSMKDPNFYTKLFIRQEDNKDILWLNLINTEKPYCFEKDFDSIPKQRKVLVSIRDELKARRNEIHQTQSAKYIESQRLFNSSLSEDVSNFDFTNTIIRHDEDGSNGQESVVCQSELHLDAIEINSHECMATICGLIEHIFNTGITELPAEDEEDVPLPTWLNGIRNVLLSKDTNKNVKIFLVKVIDNMIHIFKYYAKWFLEPLLAFLADKCAGDTINYFVTDVIAILAHWSTIAPPDDNEKTLAINVIEFLITNINNDRKDIFKYNLELVKLLVEAWKSFITFPFNLLISKLAHEITDRKLEVGIHLTSIFLANKVGPERAQVDQLWRKMLNIMKTTVRSIYRTCAETIGLLLKFLENRGEAEAERFISEAQSFLTQIEDPDKYSYCLEGVSLHFPNIANDFHLFRLLGRLRGATIPSKILYLKIIYKRTEILDGISDFRSEPWDLYLESDSLEVILITLEIIIKTVNILESLPSFKSVIQSACKNIYNPNYLCRSRIYDLTMLVYKHENVSAEVKDLCKDVLIQGLVDGELKNREKLYEFWSENAEIPQPVQARFSYLLSDLFKAKTEDSFLGYTSYFLMSVLNKAEEYEEIIFEHPLEDCDFEEYKLLTNWRIQNPSVVPMFAETLQSYQSEVMVEFGDNHQLRNTLESLAFAPTQSQPPKTLEYTNMESSLFIKPNDDSLMLNPNNMQLSQSYRKRVRFLKDKTKIQKHFANREVAKGVAKVQNRLDSVKEREKKVTIYRNYRKGDWPDVQIPLSSILKPLQVLALHDSEISKTLYTVIFKSLTPKLEDNSFIDSVCASIKNIFNTSTQYNTNLFRTLLDIVLKNKDKMLIDPNTIASVCQASGLISTGTLILEEYLISYEDQPSGSKKGTGQDNPEISYWVKLAELYKELEEWGVVRSIFLEKMNCKETVQEAIKAESEKQWRDAQDYYLELIQTDISSERKDFYYESYFKCFASLGEWEKLPKAIESACGDEQTPWDNLWDGDWYQKKLLPWYITANVKNTLFTQKCPVEFLTKINKCLTSVDQKEYLKLNFSEELCMLWLFHREIDDASHYLQSYIDSFLDDWQFINPQFSNLRYNKIVKLRNAVDIERFISLYSNLDDDLEAKINNLLTYWESSSNEILSSVLLGETRLLYRRQFIKILSEKIKTENLDQVVENLNQVKFKLDIGFINTAVDLKSFHMAKKYFQPLEKSRDEKNSHNLNLALCNIVYLKSKTPGTDEYKLSILMQTPKLLRPILDESTNEFEKLSASLKLFEISSDIYELLMQNNELFASKQDVLHLVSGKPVTSPVEIYQQSANTLLRVLDNYQNHLESFMSFDGTYPHKDCAKIGSAYVKLAYFAKTQSGNNQEQFILYVLKAMKLNSLEAKQLFPCILMIQDLGQKYKNLFVTETDNIPTWMFLGWIPQLLANVDSPKIGAIFKLIQRIAQTYPQSIMYAYRLSRENYNLEEVTPKAKELITELDNLLLNDQMVEKFLSALSNVSVPSAILKYHTEKMGKACIGGSSEKISEIRQHILQEVYGETPNSRDSTNMKGNMFKTIAEFGKEFEKMTHKNFSKILDDLKKIIEKLGTKLRNDKSFSTLLKDYCPWLSNFSAAKLNVELEIPGQYDGSKLPLVQHHIKIAGFCPSVKIMPSLRRPIKLTILGMDTKEYPFLIKFGEDIRQDQRIQQLLSLMNDIFKSDLACCNTDLNILTYQVIPLTSNLGIIQWINDTTSLQDFIGTSVKDPKTQFGKGREKYYNWITNKKPQKDGDVYGSAAVKFTRNKTIPFYQSLVNTLPWDVLRSSFWAISTNTENFIALRNNFIKSYSVLCITHWILGIGDRHLSNSLICLKNGKVLGIDFGHAFGTGTQILPVPELVPFRLTPHIVNLMEPFKENGFFKEFMVACLKSLRNNSACLLATMNVFIEEPSLDWLEHASRFDSSQDRAAIGWYPNQKLHQAERKLHGASSTSIMVEDLNAGHKGNPQYLEAFVRLVKGSAEFDKRARLGRDDNLTVEEQVECLIDHATDYNLLGRMFAGWMPWV